MDKAEDRNRPIQWISAKTLPDAKLFLQINLIPECERAVRVPGKGIDLQLLVNTHVFDLAVVAFHLVEQRWGWCSILFGSEDAGQMPSQ